jgi:hypothetical protein
VLNHHRRLERSADTKKQETNKRISRNPEHWAAKNGAANKGSSGVIYHVILIVC